MGRISEKVSLSCPLELKFAAQMIQNLPVMQKTWVWSWGQEDPLEKGMATHSRILAQRIPMGSQRVGYDWATNTYTHTHTHTRTHTRLFPRLEFSRSWQLDGPHSPQRSWTSYLVFQSSKILSAEAPRLLMGWFFYWLSHLHICHRLKRV